MLWNYFACYAIATLPLYILVSPVLSGRRSDENIEACIGPSSTQGVVCSGRGECVTGVCECFPRRSHSAERYSGKYCQCDDYSCPYHDNQLCGGHGKCVCGVCMCDEGYTDENCGCPTSPETCRSSDGKICNGVGVCECGVCICDEHSSYKGPTCEECPTCPGKCSENKNCALCVAFMTGPYTPEECREKCGHVEITHAIDEAEVKAEEHLHMCGFSDEEDDCRYFFTYEYVENNEVEVRVQGTKECPTPDAGGKVGGNPGGGSPMLESRRSVVFLTANLVSFIIVLQH